MALMTHLEPLARDLIYKKVNTTCRYFVNYISVGFMSYLLNYTLKGRKCIFF
jgi:hypothetical protein